MIEGLSPSANRKFIKWRERHLAESAALSHYERRQPRRTPTPIPREDEIALLQYLNPQSPNKPANYTFALDHFYQIICEMNDTWDERCAPQRDVTLFIHGMRPLAHAGYPYIAFCGPEEEYANDIDITLATPYSPGYILPRLLSELQHPGSKVAGHGHLRQQKSLWVEPYYISGDREEDKLDFHYLQVKPGVNTNDTFLQTFVDAYSTRLGFPIIRGRLGLSRNNGFDLSLVQPFPTTASQHQIHIPYPNIFPEHLRSIIRIPRIASLRARASYEVGECANYSAETIEAIQDTIARQRRYLTPAHLSSMHSRIKTELFKTSRLLQNIKQGNTALKTLYDENLEIGPRTILNDLRKWGYTNLLA